MSNEALIDGAGKPFADYRIRRPSFFLSLVPVQSASYPSPPKAQAAPTIQPEVTQKEATPAPAPTVEAKPVEAEAPVPHSRADSTSSVNSVASTKRFLKLGPVFWGGNGEADDYAVEG